MRYLFLLIISIPLANCKNVSKKQVTGSREAVTVIKVESKSSYADLNGNAVELTDFKGKNVVLNFWATWCRPCIEEMPSMLRAQELLGDEDYVFLLASDQSIEKIKAFQAKKQFDFQFLKFNGALTDMEINALPATFIYNPLGVMVTRIDGATEWDSPEILAQLKAIE